MIVLLAVLMAITLLNSSQLCPHDMSNYATLIANPIDCQTYFSCTKGVPILMFCPAGLHFNDRLDVCDWPDKAGCSIKIYQTVYTSLPCPDGEVMYHTLCIQGSAACDPFDPCSTPFDF